MKRIALGVGVICGILCVLCVLLFASSVKDEADSARREAMEHYGGEQIEVLVATRDIFPGELLDASNTETRTWIADLLPAESLKSLNEAKGTRVASLIVSGEVVSLRRFSESGEDFQIPEGCVALSVPAKEVQAVGGSIAKGSIVDVYATGSQTVQLASRVLVLATSAESAESQRSSGIAWVTLAIPVEQSQEFVTASQSMDLYFTLPSDSQTTNKESARDAASPELAD